MTKMQTFSRIVSLVPSQTELLVDLGLKSKLVGMTKFCVHPKNLRREIPVVGGTKQVNFNKIKALKPDIILCNKEENTLEIVNELQNIARVEVSDVNTFEDALNLIRLYGKLFKVSTSAESIIVNIETERSKFRKLKKDLPKVKVAYFIWQQPYMVAASNTFINAMIEEAGWDNVFKNRIRYPEIDLDDPDLKQADIILLSSEPFPFKLKHLKQFNAQFPEKKIMIVDGEMFSWYGSRIIKAHNYFTQIIVQ